MSDLRYDPLNDQWVTIAANRRDRPMEFIPIEKAQQQLLICPFCRGHEVETPEAIATYRPDGKLQTASDDPSNWSVRVITNKYPSFSQNGFSKKAQPFDSGPYLSNSSSGVQELIIPTPRHLTTVSQLSQHELLMSFWVYQQRISAHRAMEGIEHSMLFLNCRSAAGASLSHLHTQLIGTPVIGGFLKGRTERNQAYFEKHGVTLIQALMDWEIKQGRRILEVTDNFCVVCPYASRFAFQIWIIPRNETEDYATLSDHKRDELARICQSLIGRYETIMDEPAYNLLFHFQPFAVQSGRHWYLELFPRLTRAAGFEWGTDMWVNPISPETAAGRLKVAPV
ncbi:MAG: DUF4921 family protein [Planctomycetota bacterium]